MATNETQNNALILALQELKAWRALEDALKMPGIRARNPDGFG
jgi:hypothetical protein